MLSRIFIQDVVLIDRLSLEFCGGLNVLTGETGAGKSIVLDALGLALGSRSDSGLVRQGATQAVVSAEFTNVASEKLKKIAEENGLNLGEEVVLRRVVQKDGKSRAFANDQPIGVSLLRQVGGCLVETQGQFDTYGLLNPAYHKEMLDEFAGVMGLRTKLANAYYVWKKAEEDYSIVLKDAEKCKTEEDYLRISAQELIELSPQRNEASKLAERRSVLQNKEKMLDALKNADLALNGDKGAASNLLAAGKSIARVADKSKTLKEILDIVDRCSREIDEACGLVESAVNDFDSSPEELYRIEERLFALNKAARKHGANADDLPDILEKLKTRLDLITGDGGALPKLAKAARDAKICYNTMAIDLRSKRTEAARKLQTEVSRELPPLRFERASFEVRVEPLPEEQWSASGADDVSFLAATNAGVPAGALNKIASGGELARFMLALKVVLSACGEASTVVFDEIDTGIGGATASAVGDRMAKMSSQTQILAITHSPQVAARANMHMLVSKNTANGKTTTHVATLDERERTEEIARMLSGARVTDAAIDAALSLINDRPKTDKRARKTA